MNARAVDEEVRHIHELLSLQAMLGDRGVAFEDLDRHNAASATPHKYLAAIAGRQGQGLSSLPIR